MRWFSNQEHIFLLVYSSLLFNESVWWGEDLLLQGMSLKNIQFKFLLHPQRHRHHPRLTAILIKTLAELSSERSLTVFNGTNPRDAGEKINGVLSEMRLFVSCAFTLLATALCVTSKKHIHSGLAPTNCKLVFNSTSIQMDWERVDGGGCRRGVSTAWRFRRALAN